MPLAAPGVCSGEALPVDRPRSSARALPGCELHNLYGPTEAADRRHRLALHRPRWPAEPGCRSARPIENIRVYVLDARLAPVPVGVAGELYIGGAGSPAATSAGPA